MDTGHQRISVLLQMSGVYIALQRFVKGIWQRQIPPQPWLRSHIGKRKMQPQEFIRWRRTRRGQKLNRHLRSDGLCWFLGDKMIAPDRPILVWTGRRFNILVHWLSSHQIIGQLVSHRSKSSNEKEISHGRRWRDLFPLHPS